MASADIMVGSAMGHALSKESSMELGQTITRPTAGSVFPDPLPNPPFVFPARPVSIAQATPPSRTNHRRPHSAINIEDSRFKMGNTADEMPSGPNALPSFSFNPGVNVASPTAKLDALLSPPMSPHSPRLSPAGAGHRRGGSEFVGGEYRAGNVKMEMLGTSPTRSELGGSPALNSSVAAGGKRRGGGHAHRRSAALSSHDISNIMRPTPSGATSPRGNSAPSTPSADLNQSFSFPALPAPITPQLAEASSNSPPAEPESPRPVNDSDDQAEPPKPTPRTRVGFSDTVEFIPRPLSLVSSDTSSTATIRPGHSVSGSISSLISISNSIIEEQDESNPLDTEGPMNLESRPSTANAVLERTLSGQLIEAGATSPRRRGSLPLLSGIEMLSPTDSTPSPSAAPKRWSFFGLEAFSSSPTKREFTMPPTSSDAVAVDEEDRKFEQETGEHAMQRAASRKMKKKHIKARIWGGHILSGKSKGRHVKGKRPSRRTPTPPLVRNAMDSEKMFQSTIVPPTPEPATTSMADVPSPALDPKAWTFPKATTQDDVTYPMIDLDAALGPFNTPLPRNPEWEAAQKAGGLMKKQLHSAAGMSRFSGPGMHYNHQRAQSSPEMAPFEARRSLHRFGSSSTMADVFEEDEEEDEEDGLASDKDSTKPSSLAERTTRKSSLTSSAPSFTRSTASVETPVETKTGPPVSFNMRGLKRRGSDLESDHPWHHAASTKSDASSISMQDEMVASTPIGQTFRTVEYGQALTTDEASQPASPRSRPNRNRLAPVDVGSCQRSDAQMPLSPYSTTASSSYPSPRSAISSDAQILSTAPSSVADDSYGSLLNGEPGPEVRCSMDARTPSLLSSTSTMTRESATPRPLSQRARPTTSSERPASMLSLGPFSSRRGSLASLKRLINSSHGERSKLSVEVTYRDEAGAQPKPSRSKRLSRLVQFWKPKEADT